MKYIVIDVSTPTMVLGFITDNTIDIDMKTSKQDHAQNIIDRMDCVLKKHHETIKTIDGIIVGVGPGSYTGLRIAVMTAKMLGYVNHMNVYEISSLYLLSSGYQNPVKAMIDARRGHVFAAIYNDAQTIMTDHMYDRDELESGEYKEYPSVLLDESTIRLDATRILKMMKKVEDVHALEPNYLRKTEAEMNHDQKS